MQKKDILDYLKSYKKQLLKKYNIKRIILFGSFAKDTQNEKSDIDIAVEIENPSFLLLFEIKEELEKKFKRKVDIVRLREKMNRYLKNRIQKEGIIV
ncbi:type VII toxin-antitoxin system MntA family adenylyltransferase antitoxin [Nitrosophilus labii]|uniref:type VII toxin-antitoxin system MntA family adenylyltransferase antitoxin n=1 Tax=Nitrosophilus labii TaxID=2706014 RepID=UPI001656FE1B|nr:nucleotidyltransferase domain-containing protein [Nitrosophilus labii]